MAPDRRTTPWLRRLACAFAAIGVVLCTSLMLAGPSAAMDMDSTPTPTPTATATSTPAGAAAGVIVGSDTVASPGCEGTCAVDTTIACATAVVATVALFLLVGFRRSRHRALAPRQTLLRAQRTAGGEQPPWSALCPFRLCVMRV